MASENDNHEEPTSTSEQESLRPKDGKSDPTPGSFSALPAVDHYRHSIKTAEYYARNPGVKCDKYYAMFPELRGYLEEALQRLGEEGGGKEGRGDGEGVKKDEMLMGKKKEDVEQENTEGDKNVGAEEEGRAKTESSERGVETQEKEAAEKPATKLKGMAARLEMLKRWEERSKDREG